MLTLSSLAVSAATVLVLLALAAALAGLVTRRTTTVSLTTPAPEEHPEPAFAGSLSGRHTPSAGVHPHPRYAAPAGPVTHARGSAGRGLGWFASALADLALAALTVGLLARTIAVGHGPFANQHEFAVAFAWGLLVASAWARWRHHAQGIAVAVLPIALGMLLYAATLAATPNPLVAALQHNLLLTVHVLAAVVGYGAAGVACASAALSLARPALTRLGVREGGIPGVERLDDVGYQAVAVAFPLMTVMLILGSIWAERAWGTYWNWDPKETAALVTWLIYGGYLHARVTGGWRGRRAAWLLVLGFVAVLFTYFGNLFLGGMHSYA